MQSLKPFFNTRFNTERLVIRKLTARDISAFFETLHENDGSMRRFFAFPEKFCQDAQSVRDYILPGMARFEKTRDIYYLGAFRAGCPDHMIGMVVCNRDLNRKMRIGYFVRTSERRRGYGVEMYHHLMHKFGQHLGQRSMVAEVAPENRASIGMLYALGFTANGIRTGTINRQETRRMLVLNKTLRA